MTGVLFLSGTLAAGTGGVYNNITTVATRSMAIDPSTPATLYAGTERRRRFQEHQRRNQLDRRQLRPHGTRFMPWRLIPPLPPRSMPGPMAAAFSRAPTEERVGPPSTPASRTHNVFALAIDPSTPATLYAGTDGGRRFQEHQRRNQLDRRQLRPHERICLCPGD